MNPVLLKPQSDRMAQVIVQGKIYGTSEADDYQDLKPKLLDAVIDSFEQLCDDAELVLVEGAGSPAEVNLRVGDIANMGFAEAAGVPVVLAGDIDRGGVIASLVGTHALLPEREINLIKGFIINKFRGDLDLFDDGLKTITERTGWPCLGVLPFISAVRRLPAEDSLDSTRFRRAEDASVRISVPILERIANFDEFDPLIAEPGVSLEMVPPGTPLPGDTDLVVIPGSKSTLSDLKFFKAQGWDVDLQAHIRRGGAVLGICAGYQMLGQTVSDPHGVEGAPGSASGLELLDVSTELTGDKTLRQVNGVHLTTREPVFGYEMHQGHTEGPGCDRPLLNIDGRDDGAVTADGRIAGCYVHGIFASDGFRQAYLGELRQGMGKAANYRDEVNRAMDELADAMEADLDVERILQIAQGRA